MNNLEQIAEKHLARLADIFPNEDTARFKHWITEAIREGVREELKGLRDAFGQSSKYLKLAIETRLEELSKP
jgi:hypothetical protein